MRETVLQMSGQLGNSLAMSATGEVVVEALQPFAGQFTVDERVHVPVVTQVAEL